MEANSQSGQVLSELVVVIMLLLTLVFSVIQVNQMSRVQLTHFQLIKQK